MLLLDAVEVGVKDSQPRLSQIQVDVDKVVIYRAWPVLRQYVHSFVGHGGFIPNSEACELVFDTGFSVVINESVDSFVARVLTARKESGRE